MTEQPWLILPIETKVRELDAKTYLACAAAEAGFRVLIGEQNALLRRLALLPRGFYMDKSIARPKVQAFSRLNSLGFRILASCEEGLVYRNRDAYLHERVAPAAFERVDTFFAWGSVQRRDMCTVITDADNKIIETGNPRFDLLRPGLREFYRPAAATLRERFGDFILVNTNFARFNHYFGRDRVIEILRQRGSIRNAADEAFFHEWIDFLGKLHGAFQEMLPRLAEAFPDHTIIVRPHPSESHDSWHRRAEGLPNVRVLYEGGVVPWLMAAAVSIHNSCTTGLEAALLDRPVITYRPAKSESYDSHLPNRVSVEAESLEELIDRLRDTLAGAYEPRMAKDEQAHADVRRYIASMEGPEATGRIVERLLALAGSESPAIRAGFMTAARDQGEQWARSFIRTALAPLRSTGGYARQKFPGLTASEVDALIARFRTITGRFQNVRIVRNGHLSVTLSAR